MSKSIFDSMSIEELKEMGVKIEEGNEKEEFEEIEMGSEEEFEEIELESDEEFEEIEMESEEEFEEIELGYEEGPEEGSEEEFGGEFEEINTQEDYSEEEILEQIGSDEDLLDPVYTKKEPEDVLSKMEGEGEEIEIEKRDLIYDSTGKPVEFQVEGKMYTKEILLDQIYLPPRTRRTQRSGTDDLESLIIQWGLIEPLHVIPFNGKYLLMHGFRRYRALKNLNIGSAICLVDETRPKTTLRFLEVLCNNSNSLNLFEIMDFGEFVERKQKTFQNDTIEKIIGMEPGDYLKAKYIRQYDSFGIIGDVASGKKTIKEGFKRLERELDKIEKERVDMLNEEYNDQGLPESYLEAIEEEENFQDVKDRKPLPPHVYARIKARDKHTCQTCGIGYDQPELNAIHEVHHIIPVAQGGSDSDENLVLICSNCHKVVGAYINGQFKPPVDTEEIYKNMILLGNIARRGAPEGVTPYHFYMENSIQDWLI